MRQRSVFWNSAVYAIKQFLVLVLNCLSSDVTLGSGTGESAAIDDDDMFGGSDAFVDVAARIELSRPPDEFLLEPLGVHRAFLRSLDEQGRRRPAVANDNALENKFSTGGAEVVLDRPELKDDKYLWMMRLEILGGGAYFVSHLRLFSLLIQSSFRPRERYFPVSTWRKRSPV